MSAEENKAIISRLLDDVWNGGEPAVADDLLAPDFVRHGPAMEGEARGPQGFRQLVATYRAVLPDLQVAAEGVTAEGDTVVTRWTVRGTHVGEFLGSAGTGRPVAARGVIIDRLAGGRIAEEWASFDSLSLVQQLGVIPAPGQGAP
jgi:steroid delta-isomerase-like uncharacterized protein